MVSLSPFSSSSHTLLLSSVLFPKPVPCSSLCPALLGRPPPSHGALCHFNIGRLCSLFASELGPCPPSDRFPPQLSQRQSMWLLPRPRVFRVFLNLPESRDTLSSLHVGGCYSGRASSAVILLLPVLLPVFSGVVSSLFLDWPGQ